jgi:hypothetical protein
MVINFINSEHCIIVNCNFCLNNQEYDSDDDINFITLDLKRLGWGFDEFTTQDKSIIHYCPDCNLSKKGGFSKKECTT